MRKAIAKPLEELCEFRNGLWKGNSPPYLRAGVIRNTNFNGDGSLDESDIAFLDVEVKQIKNRQLQFGDIILEKSGGGPKQPVGRVITFEKRDGVYSFSNFTSLIRVRNPGQLDFRFLHRVLFWYYSAGVTEGMQRRSTGIRNLDFSAYKRLDIPLPPLTEQRRIVGILDEAFAGIAIAKANAEKNLQNARALFESRREAVLTECGDGWDTRPLSELCDIKHGFAFQSRFFSDHGDYVLLTPGNFYESGGYRDRGEKQKYYCGEIPDGFVLRKGDLLVAMTEQAAGLLGSPVLIPESDTFLHNQRLGLVTKKPRIPWTNEFFFHVFNTRRVRREIHDSASGVKVRHTSPKKIGGVKVSFPSSETEQHEITSNLQALRVETERLASIHRRKVAVLDELKKSLLHQAFSGQL